MVYFESVLDITRAYLHGTTIQEKEAKNRLTKSPRRQVNHSDFTKIQETITKEQERFRSFFQSKEVSETKEVRERIHL